MSLLFRLCLIFILVKLIGFSKINLFRSDFYLPIILLFNTVLPRNWLLWRCCFVSIFITTYHFIIFLYLSIFHHSKLIYYGSATISILFNYIVESYYILYLVQGSSCFQSRLVVVYVSVVSLCDFTSFSIYVVMVPGSAIGLKGRFMPLFIGTVVTITPGF